MTQKHSLTLLTGCTVCITTVAGLLNTPDLIMVSCVLFQYVEEDEFVDAIKALSSVKKEHTMFTDTHL